MLIESGAAQTTSSSPTRFDTGFDTGFDTADEYCANHVVFSYRTIEYYKSAYPRNGHKLQCVMGRITILQVPRVPLKSASEDPLGSAP